MQSFTEVISRLGGPDVVAPILKAKVDTVRKMAWRNSVPSDYWPSLIDFARDQRVAGVTYARLAKLKKPRKARAPSKKRRAA